MTDISQNAKPGRYETIGGYVGAAIGGAVGIGAFKLAAWTLTGTALTFAGVSIPAIAALAVASILVGAVVNIALNKNRNQSIFWSIFAGGVAGYAVDRGLPGAILTKGVFGSIGYYGAGGFAAAGMGIGRFVGRQFDKRRAPSLEAA